MTPTTKLAPGPYVVKDTFYVAVKPVGKDVFWWFSIQNDVRCFEKETILLFVSFSSLGHLKDVFGKDLYGEAILESGEMVGFNFKSTWIKSYEVHD